jgi:hypothetical protein
MNYDEITLNNIVAYQKMCGQIYYRNRGNNELKNRLNTKDFNTQYADDFQKIVKEIESTLY